MKYWRKKWNSTYNLFLWK